MKHIVLTGQSIMAKDWKGGSASTFKTIGASNHTENFKIMVGGQVVGMAKEAKFSIAEDDASTKEFSDHWHTPDIKQSWDISCDAMVRDAGDVLRDLLNGKEKWDVTIGQEVGKLPRKMKKAIHSKRMTKWKQKVASYINCRQIRIHDAEMVVTPDQFDTLKATISVGTSSALNSRRNTTTKQTKESC